jgi:glycosyltransferase involved in cell wall biosynthesis
MISFVVPAHNEAPLLGATLRAIRAAAGERHEIIVVDDSSTDDTASIAERAGARVISVALRQISAVRNAGAREARGEFLFFVDADTVVNAAVVAEALGALREGAVAGGAPFRFDGELPLWVRVLEPAFLGYQRAARLAAGCFFFCRRDAFERVGGFDRKLFAGEEIMLSKALQREGRFVVVRESVRTSGRKVRTHAGREHLRVAVRYFLYGRKSIESRQGLGLWYDKRRPDPEQAA